MPLYFNSHKLPSMFDDIRPYNEQEVPQVIASLLNEAEFIESVAAFSLPKMHRHLPGLTKWAIKRLLAWQSKSATSVEAIQLKVCKYLEAVIDRTTDGLTVEGLESLDLSKPCLFISNHRDIVLDVALINYALDTHGHPTVEAAVGDNLLSKKWVADLMRINKSFIVKRNESTKRAQLNASKQLSAYIHHSLQQKHQHVWIAQKEGRAKDGIDRTNAALISMLLLNKAKEESIAQYLTQLNIIPVAIAYEYDPCDRHKAKELAQINSDGHYQKQEHEDLKSISKGILGHKGQVHISFGQPINGEFENSKAIAAEIDQQIIANYKLFPSNLSAYDSVTKQTDITGGSLAQRLDNLTAEQKKWLLAMYANPVNAQKTLSNETDNAI